MYPEKTTDMSQITDKLYHIMLHRKHIAIYSVRYVTVIFSAQDNAMLLALKFVTSSDPFF
jgi:hypothetical protein